MKKFLALVFALIFAISACTVAFAATTWECDVCHAVLSTEAAYNTHMSGGCLEQFDACQYCEAKVKVENLAAHEGACPKGASTCDKCGADLANKTAADAHTCATEDVVSNVVDKAIEALKSVDWAALANKVVEAVKGIDFEGIIAKIKPIIEKVVAFVEGIAA